MKLLILSKVPNNYPNKRLIEEATKRGHDIEIVDYTKCYITVEKGNPLVSYGGQEVKGVDVIIPRISPSLTSYGSSIVRQFEMQNVQTITSSISLKKYSITHLHLELSEWEILLDMWW